MQLSAIILTAPKGMLASKKKKLRIFSKAISDLGDALNYG